MIFLVENGDFQKRSLKVKTYELTQRAFRKKTVTFENAFGSEDF